MWDSRVLDCTLYLLVHKFLLFYLVYPTKYTFRYHKLSFLHLFISIFDCKSCLIVSPISFHRVAAPLFRIRFSNKWRSFPGRFAWSPRIAPSISRNFSYRCRMATPSGVHAPTHEGAGDMAPRMVNRLHESRSPYVSFDHWVLRRTI